jgi:hypothetical protein
LDVTDALEANNELRIELDAARPPVGKPSVYGVLGCPTGDVQGSHRKPLSGILGGVQLEVTSRRLSLADPAIRCTWESAGGRLAIRAGVNGVPGTYPLDVRLDGTVVFKGFVGPEAMERGWMDIDTTSLDVERWWPRTLGSQRLYESKLTIYDDEAVLFSTTRPLGFRTIEDRGAHRWCCNGVEWTPGVGEVWPEHTFGSCDERRGTFDPAGQDWTQAELLRVVAHIAPEAFYHFCDQTGMLVLQYLPYDTGSVAGQEAAAIVNVGQSLGRHPCIVGRRLDSREPNEAERILSEQLKACDPDRMLRIVEKNK